GIETLQAPLTADPATSSPLVLGVALHAEAGDHRVEPRADRQRVIAAQSCEKLDESFLVGGQAGIDRVGRHEHRYIVGIELKVVWQGPGPAAAGVAQLTTIKEIWCARGSRQLHPERKRWVGAPGSANPFEQISSGPTRLRSSARRPRCIVIASAQMSAR